MVEARKSTAWSAEVSSRRIPTLSLFSGAGGLDLGSGLLWILVGYIEGCQMTTFGLVHGA
jgi:hypothetical protein